MGFSLTSIFQSAAIIFCTIMTLPILFATWTLLSNLYLLFSKLRHLPQPEYPSRNPLKILLEGHGLLGLIFHPDPIESGSYLSSARESLKSAVFVITGPLFKAEVVVISPSSVRTIAQSSSCSFSKSLPFRQMIQTFTGNNSIFVVEGRVHRRLRHAIGAALKHDNLVRLDRNFLRRGQLLADELASDATYLAPIYVVRRATFDMIITACFGEGVVGEDDMQHLLNLYHGTLDDDSGHHPMLMCLSMIMPFVPHHWVSTQERYKLELRRRVRELCINLLEQKQRPQLYKANKREKMQVTPLLSIMHEACDEGHITAEELEKTVLSFLVAGQATTTLAFAWAVYLLAVHGDWQARVYDEIRGSWEPSQGLSVLDDLPLLHRVVKETIRLHPPLQNTVRTTDCPVLIDGYSIPAGVTVRVPFAVLQRLEDYWGADAQTFNPDRFLHLERDANTRWLWSAFWFGPHSCVGQRFALLEIKAFLAMTLLKYRVIGRDVEMGTGSKHVDNKQTPEHLELSYELRSAATDL